jgi:tRNA dimethylallyltransferase
MKLKNKIICVVGPTASGKTSLAVKLAKIYGGEIISADSRQVYRYMDVGTGKDLPDYQIPIKNYQLRIKNFNNFKIAKKQGKHFINIPYHLIDIIHPNTAFDLAKFVKKANVAIEGIKKRGRVPIIAGGTGLYVQALVDGYNLSSVKPDKKLREELEMKTVKQLLLKLKKLDIKKYRSLNNSDKNNKRRLIRYIEITKQLKINPTPQKLRGAGNEKLKIYNNSITREYLVIGIARDIKTSKSLIYKRLIQRLEQEDMIGEVQRLHKVHRVSWKRMINFGLEYKYITLYLRGELSYDEMVEKLYIAICQFAKRQRSWYRRWEKQGQKIYWVNDIKEVRAIIKDRF